MRPDRKCGTKTYEKKREVQGWNGVTVIPVEIEVSWELDNFVKNEILDNFDRNYKNWIQE